MTVIHLNELNLAEQKIKENWRSPDIIVSIVCTAFNHESYIRDALNGFLSQQTDFAFEVIVHDDASTDRTAEIIREYAIKYPSIIKPIYQETNQYSQGINIGPKYIWPLVKGQFIALCEGDDYWIDSIKLQKQVDALKYYEQCDICFHQSCCVTPDGRKRLINEIAKNPKILTCKEVLMGTGGYMGTASIMYRTSVYLKYLDFLRDKQKPPIGDKIIQFLGSSRGGAVYLPMVGSVYRVRSKGSWTERYTTNLSFRQEFIPKRIELNEQMNSFSNYAYHKEFYLLNRKLLINTFLDAQLSKEFKLNLSQNYKQYRKSSDSFLLVFLKLKRFLRSEIKNTLIWLGLYK